MKLLAICLLMSNCTHLAIAPSKTVETVQMEQCSKKKTCDQEKTDGR